MHTAVACPNLYRRGGIERVAIETIRGLDRCGHRVAAAASYVEPGVLPEGLDVADVPRPKLGSIGNIARFGSACARVLERSGPPQAVLGFGATSPDDAVVWVQSVHARWLATAKEERFRGQMKRHLNPFHRVAIYREHRLFGGGCYRKLLALTTQVASDLMHFYGVKERDIEVVPNGVSCDEFKLMPSTQCTATQQDFGLEPDHRVMCFVANESDRKGLPQLMEALSRLNDPTLRLLVAGRVGQAVESLSQEFGVEDRVVWVGQVEEVAPVFAASDLFVLPTAYEAWGLVIVEALACGTPVITTRLAGASEAVTPGSNGFLLDRADDVDALVHAIEQSLSRKDWDRQAVSDSVANYTWDGIIPRVAEILESCYAERPWQPKGIQSAAVVGA
jgi:UDP-glucose:(heptosyl)LPS alpha-1,3-glucosyltransferase